MNSPSDPRIREIKKRCRLAMNGIVSTTMRNSGVAYKLNFGLTLPLIRTIAAHYTPDAELAQLLWEDSVRESKILATMLYPISLFSPQLASKWAEQTPTYEVANYACLHLYSKLEHPMPLAIEWVADSNPLVQYAGYQLLGRIAATHTPTQQQIEQLATSIINQLEAASTTLQTAITQCTTRLVVEQPEIAPLLLDTLSPTTTPTLYRLYQLLQEEYNYSTSSNN